MTAVRKVRETGDGSITLVLNPCPACSVPGEVPGLSRRAYNDWSMNDVPIEEAFPQLDPDTRHMLVSGIHGKCLDEMFPPEE